MLAMMVLLPGKVLYVAPSPWRWLMVAGQLLAVLAVAVSLLQTGAFHFLGISQLFADRPTQNTPLNLRGFYKWVRHPLYTFSLVFLWLSPVMTTNTLTA
jgi:protein-S-isoprenylcysteine O-methyltransferase Ste14